jgi:biopolymer transport protein ExbB/TolQ
VRCQGPGNPTGECLIYTGQDMSQSLYSIILNGGVPMWFIIFASILALAVGLERAAAVWKLRQNARVLTQTVVRCLSRGAVAEARTACERTISPLAEVFLVGFERMGRGTRDSLEAGVDRERQKLNLNLKSRLWILGTIGALAPFVGLFGTVVGIMNAFNSISTSGNVSITVVGKPIAEALVATAAGILVAVESVVIYNYFNQHLARISIEFKLMVEEFLEVLPRRVEDGAALAAASAADAASEKGK